MINLVNLIFAFVCCLSKNQKDNTIIRAELVQLRESIYTVTDVSCEGFDTAFGVYDTLDIMDKLPVFFDAVKNSRPINKGGLDTRMKVYIAYSNGTEDVFCFGVSDKFFKNGVLMELENDDFFRELMSW